MYWHSLTLAALPLCFAINAFAQTDHAPTPAPELKKLDYFVGDWKAEGHMKPGPMGPGGTMTSTDHYEWQQGKFFVVGHSDFKSSMGDGVELSVLGYDPEKKLYTYRSFNSAGEAESATGTLSGDTWTWNSGDDQKFKWRYIQKMVSPTAFNVRFEALNGSNWATMFDATVTKQ